MIGSLGTLFNLQHYNELTWNRIYYSNAMIKIGVSGHRFLSEVEKISQGIDQALDQMNSVYGDRPFQVISPLAEGADCLAAQLILNRKGSELVVPLPLPEDDYLKDFHSSESKSEFYKLIDLAVDVIRLPPAMSRADAYKNVGTYLVDHSDVMLVVWDGQTAQGMGGTGDVAFAAREKRLPLAWVRAGSPAPGTNNPISLGQNQGKVVYENFPDSPLSTGFVNNNK